MLVSHDLGSRRQRGGGILSKSSWLKLPVSEASEVRGTRFPDNFYSQKIEVSH